MTYPHQTLEVYKTGPLTVVGFGGVEILDQIDLAACRNEIVQLLEQTQCKVLGFDLTGVKLIPSGLLGLLASLRRMGIEVHLYNPSPDVKDVLEVTQLHTLMPVHYVDVRNV
jgi:anti-sigma B factor antagonist